MSGRTKRRRVPEQAIGDETISCDNSEADDADGDECTSPSRRLTRSSVVAEASTALHRPRDGGGGCAIGQSSVSRIGTATGTGDNDDDDDKEEGTGGSRDVLVLVDIARELREAVDGLSFGPPVTHVYNPLDYAWDVHATYLRRYGHRQPVSDGGGEDGTGTGDVPPRREVVLVGMNPGPFGMAQTGVPFGEVNLVRDWLGVVGRVSKPRGEGGGEHPKRPVLGFDCPRSEVSGARLWGWARDRFGTPDRFFDRFFVHNYCPLVFMEGRGGRNRTPDKLKPAERAALFDACDEALRRTVAALRPRVVIGVGKFAEDRARAALGGLDGVEIGRILHPSPASPKANRGWAGQVECELEAMGINVPEQPI